MRIIENNLSTKQKRPNHDMTNDKNANPAYQLQSHYRQEWAPSTSDSDTIPSSGKNEEKFDFLSLNVLLYIHLRFSTTGVYHKPWLACRGGLEEKFMNK